MAAEPKDFTHGPEERVPAPPMAGADLDHGDENPWASLDPQHAQAAEWFVAGESVKAIAKELGVDRTTVWRWLHRPEVEGYRSLAAGTVPRRVVPPDARRDQQGPEGRG